MQLDSIQQEIPLPLLPLRFHVEAPKALQLADLTGAVRMRGAFGLFFRRLVCPPHWWPRDCRACELMRTCAYPTFFEPAPPEGIDRLRLNADVPRPYVFKPTRLDTAFDITFIGRGCEAIPYAVAAIRQLGSDGYGPTRQHFRLRRIVTREPQERILFDSSKATLNNLVPLVSTSTAGARRSRSGMRTYCFLTPTVLKAAGRVELVPSYGTLVKRARDRVNALCTFFGRGPLTWPFREMGARASQMQIAATNGGRQRHERFSRRQLRMHDLSGFVGEVTYEGPEDVFREFDPLLRLLDEIHVGKGSALGNGWIKEMSPDSPHADSMPD